MNPMLCTIRACIRSARQVKYSTLPSEAVIFTEDNCMVVCWHPEKAFPYECSLPLPEEKPNTSVLCIGNKEITEMFRKKKEYQVVEELAKVTYTTKHKWYPRTRDKKAKDTEPDRPYL
ncbi:PREDICTED: 39S ribosomal protein L42, mitochondrial [Trachymyrmex cornetzi]|uniref:Large ribosomal subunit protein mL42 n=1 Tax=Trachymyrmex cornetzi TaxID=471704 RepID=A0A195EII3_9HYME|nr:PREDICTED: 39S ribosomal protein L42, mitochondrial [Trachymyrmex cornetzi]KYN27707.1 39S ribosomal protein L42, mitochondrial [Trachymyrmex cornetzi]